MDPLEEQPGEEGPSSPPTESRWEPVLIASALVIILVAVVWFWLERGFDSLIGLLASITAIFSYISIKNRKVNWFIAGALVVVAIIGIILVCWKPSPPKIVIVDIQFDGTSKQEPDEYVLIRNEDKSAIDLKGWKLVDKDQLIEFVFPEYVLQPKQECRIYTNELHTDTCGFNLECGRAIWSNEGDCAYLSDPEGNPPREFCYGKFASQSVSTP